VCVGVRAYGSVECKTLPASSQRGRPNTCKIPRSPSHTTSKHTHTHTHTRHTYAHTHARTHAHASGSSHCTSASLSLVRAQPPPTPSHPLSSGKACEISVLVVSLPCSLRRCLSLSLAHSLYPMHPHPHANSLPLLVCSHPYPSPLPRSRTVLIRCGSPAQYSSLASVPPLVAPASGG